MKKDRKTRILLILNAYLFLSAAVITLYGVLCGAGDGQLGDKMIGLGYFKAYTMDSNILMGLVALVCLVFLVRKMRSGREIPHAVNVLYLSASVSVALTFITVLFFLAPTSGIRGGISLALSFYSEDMFFFHFLNPAVGVFCFLLLTDDKDFGIREKIIGILPTFVYSLVYAVNVAVLKTWSDFYGFTFGGHYALAPVVMVMMYAVVFGMECAMTAVRKSRKLHR